MNVSQGAKVPAKLRIYSGWIWILLIMVLSSCQAQSTPMPEQTKQISLLVSLDAPAFIKRDGWKDYQPVGFGAIIYPTDLLKTDGEIKLLCADRQTVKTFTKIGRNPCPLSTSNRVLNYGEMFFISGSRGAPPSTIPYILYPRNTTILETRPVLRWNDTKSSNYTVEIWQGSDIVWQQDNVSTSEFTYPATAPELQPGKDYLLVVQDNDTGESSNADPNKGLGFQVVNLQQRTELENEQKTIQGVDGLDTSAQEMALALYFYQIQINGRGLWGNAEDLFTEALQLQPESPALHLRLGDSLAKMKLWSEAKAEYEIALSLAQSLADLESQADALVALWQITGDQADFDQAVSLYNQIGAKYNAETLKSTRVGLPTPTSISENDPICGSGLLIVPFLIIGERLRSRNNKLKNNKKLRLTKEFWNH